MSQEHIYPVTQDPNAVDFHGLLIEGFGLKGVRSGDPVGQAVLLGLSGVAEGLASADLSERAKASRAVEAMIAVHNGEAKPTFGESGYSAEEVRAGLIPIAMEPEVEVHISDGLREGLQIPKPSEEFPTKASIPMFTEDEAPVAATLIGYGLAVASEVQKSKKSQIKPNDIWSDENLARLTSGLLESGALQHGQEVLLPQVRAKLLHGLEAEIRQNEGAQRLAKRELDKL